jgi:hypothetical protein
MTKEWRMIRGILVLAYFAATARFTDLLWAN